MNHRDIAALMAGLAPVIRDYVVEQVKGFGERIAKIEARPAPERGEKGESGEPGKAVDPEQIAALVASEIARLLPAAVDKAIATLPPQDVKPLIVEAIAALPKPADGKDADPAAIKLMVAEEVAKIPAANDGKSVTVDDVRPVLEELVAALPKPADGKDADPAAIKLMVAEEVAKIPAANDGKSVTVDDVRPVLEELVAALPKPADGKSVTIDDIKPLVAEAVAAIPVPQNGKSVSIEDIEPLISTGIAKAVMALPPAKDGDPGAPGQKGDPGRDGRDASDLPMLKGFIAEQARSTAMEVFSTFNVATEDDGRSLNFKLEVDGETVNREVKTALPLDRGVWRPGAYKKGDGATLNGSFFIAQQDTESKPETDASWRLAIKRGRDGRDGKPGEKGLPGAKGERGEQGPRGYGG